MTKILDNIEKTTLTVERKKKKMKRRNKKSKRPDYINNIEDD